MKTKSTMDKLIKKTRVYYNREVINRLISKYGVSKGFITMSLIGTRESETSESIKKDYPKMVKAINELLNTL